jgi:hypothetical protein
MRASIQDITRVIKSDGVPKQITQESFDHDPSHYWRLCNLGGSPPQASDLVNYAYDMQYMELQSDLLRYLTPVLLAAWRKDLFEGNKIDYGGFVEQFWPALLKGKALNEVYSDAERIAFISYMRNSILDRLDAEDSLRFSGMGAAPYRWVQTFVSYGTLFSDVAALWTEWWQMKTSGHAIAAFQYVSALLYEDTQNPVFDPWTRDKGGGPPALWECCGMMFNAGWRKENTDFLKSNLSVDYVEQKLQLALGQIQNRAVQKIAAGILQDLSGQKTLLALRIEQLPELLLDVSSVDGFTI